MKKLRGQRRITKHTISPLEPLPESSRAPVILCHDFAGPCLKRSKKMQFIFIVMIASTLSGCSAGSRSLFSRLKPSEYVHPAVERGDDRPHDGRDTGVWHFACVDLFFFSLDGKASACHDLLPTKDTTPVFIFPIGAREHG